LLVTLNRVSKLLKIRLLDMVPGGGIEPPRAEARRILSYARTAIQRFSAVCTN